jgi:hypothetical protein
MEFISVRARNSADILIERYGDTYHAYSDANFQGQTQQEYYASMNYLQAAL